MSKPTELHRYWVTDPETGHRRKTTYRMDRETALQRFPDAVPVPHTVGRSAASYFQDMQAYLTTSTLRRIDERD